MSKRCNNLRPITRLIGMGCIAVLLAFGSFTHAQKRTPKRRPSSQSNFDCEQRRLAKKRFKKDNKQLNLQLSCSPKDGGVVDFPGIGGAVTGFDINGVDMLPEGRLKWNKIILNLRDGKMDGKVFAYSLSEYCLNANVGMSFDPQGGGPPKQLTLRLTQTATDQFTLRSAPNIEPEFTASFTCTGEENTTMMQ